MKPYFRLSKLGAAMKAKGKRIREAPPFGTWMLDYRDALGRRVRRASKAKTEAEAIRETLEAEEREAAIARGEDVGPAFRAQRWESVRDAYLEAHAHLASLRTIRSEFRHFFDPAYRGRVFSSITPAECEAMLSKARAKGYAPASVRQLHRRGKVVWKFAADRLSAAKSNPWAKVPTPSVPQKRPLTLKREEVESLFAHAGPKLRLPLLLTAFTGLRKGELAALRWSDFDFTAGRSGVIHVSRSWGRETTKGKKERSIPIHPAIRDELLREYRSRSSNDALLFPGPHTGKIRPGSWDLPGQLRTAAKRAGVTLPPKFTWHSLRSTFISHVVRQTQDLKAAQRLAGHSSITITAGIYLAHEFEQLEDAVAAVDFAPRHKNDTAGKTGSSPRLVKTQKQ